MRKMKFKTVLVLVAMAAAVLATGGCKKNSADVIKIGLIVPLSGVQAYFGTELRKGAQLAVDQINDAGGLLGKKVELVAQDDENNPDKTVNVYSLLTSREKISLLIGSATSTATTSIAAKAQAEKKVLITPTGTNVTVTQAGDYVFRACFIDPFQGIVGARFAFDDLKARKAALFFDNGNDYSVGLADSFRAEFKRMGGTIVADESYQTGDVDFKAQLTNIKATDPDLIFLPDYYQIVSLIMKQARQAGMTRQALLGGEGWGSLYTLVGDEANNSYFSTGFAAESQEPSVQAFVKAFTQRHGIAPEFFSAHGYDSVMLLRDAILKAGSADATAVKTALAGISGSYATGKMRFDANRDPIKSAVIFEIVNSGGQTVEKYLTTVNP